jgi:hypothetical protein
MRAAIVSREAGEPDKAQTALWEADIARTRAFPEGSPGAKALSVLLDEAARVPEAIA